MRVSFSNFHNVLCRKRKTWSHRKKFVKSGYYKTMKFFSEEVDFTEFLLKLSETKLEIAEILSHAFLAKI